MPSSILRARHIAPALLLSLAPALCHAAVTYSTTNLNPLNSSGSHALAATGTLQAGDAAPGISPLRAYLWSSSAASFVNLHPTLIPNDNQASSAVNGISATRQVGSVTSDNNYGVANSHAFLWTGTAASAVDLNPAGFTQSYANATTGTQFGGKGLTVAGPTHALLWTANSPAAALDLNPAGFDSSEIKAIAPGIQVGLGFNVSALRTHAVVWFDSAASAVDLHQFLPAGYNSSQAWGVTPEGYIVGSATNDDTTHAFLWIPSNAVPEPSSLSLLALAALPLLRRRRKV